MLSEKPNEFKNMLKNQLIYAIVFLVLPFLTSAQTRTLSLKEALSIADKNNYSSQSAEARIEMAKASYRMSSAVFLPNLSVNHTAVRTNDPLSSFGFKLKQEITTQADFNPSLLNDPDNINNFQTQLKIQQPLLNLDGIFARKAAKNQFEAIDLQGDRVKLTIRFEVKKAYYMLELAESSVNVLSESVKVAEEALRLTENNEEQGFAKKADVLEAAVRLEERKNQLLEAKNQQQTANNYLAHLLGMDQNQQFQTSDSLTHPVQLFVDNDIVNLENRSDLKAYQKQIEATENLVRSNKMKFIPRLNAFGSYEWNDSKLLGTSANNFMIGASLSWDLFSGYRNAGAVQQANAQLEEAKINYQDYLSQSELQINQAKRKLELNFNKIESSKLAKDQATESLRIRTDRFKQGLEKAADLLFAEALSSQKKLEYIQSIYNYKQSVFEMELLLEEDINE